MTLLEHLEELRRRVFFALLGLGVTATIGLWQEDRLLHLLMRPTGVTHLVALTVLEPMLVKFKVALVFGVVAAFPWLLLQALLFVAPALSGREAAYVLPITSLSLALSVAGVVFGYFFILPPSTQWLIDQAGTVMSMQITALSYVSYSLWFLAALAIAFQTPLVVLSLVGLGVLSRSRLRREWRTVYMVITVLAAVITPDWSPVTMLLVAAAMVGLYELSLLLARVIFPNR
ncbi:MAG TPA: twin-arginine translocase subunit TatC [Terrimicrobiaceae bacterium]|nr:twin-arginine translocase subunit TatC [Terrimicrobiaceae bacterium]